MNHACVCGHQPSSHYGDTGACEHLGDDGMAWFYDCNCPRYEWEGDN